MKIERYSSATLTVASAGGLPRDGSGRSLPGLVGTPVGQAHRKAAGEVLLIHLSPLTSIEVTALWNF